MVEPVADVQYVHQQLALPLLIIDFSLIKPSECTSKLEQWLYTEHHRGFDLTQGPLLRVHILKLAANCHILVLSAHHIVIDGWSTNVILEEVGTLYSARVNGSSYQLPPVTQFSDYIQWQKQQSQSLQKVVNEAYWLEQFSDTVPVLELPIDHPRPPVKTYRGAKQSMFLETEHVSKLKAMSKAQNCTLFMLLLAAYTTLLHRLAGQDDIVVGIPFAGQTLVDVHLVGDCADVVPLRSHTIGNPTFADYLASVKHTLLSAYEHQPYTLASLIERLNPSRDRSQIPIVSTTFNMDRTMTLPQIENFEAKIIDVNIWHTTFDISINIVEVEQKLQIEFYYNKDLFNADTVRQVQGYLRTLLENIVTQPEQRLTDLPLLSEAERYQLLIEWNSQTDNAQEVCVHELFEQQVERTPDAVALVFEDQLLTYAELNRRANQLAHHLQDRGVGPEMLVGICMQRSLEMVVALLGVLKAGGAYVPLDPTYPQGRLAFMTTDSQVVIVLTHQLLEDHWQQTDGVQAIYLDTDWEVVAAREQMNLYSGVTSDNLAYVIYTSGSTGRPKGTMVTHRNVTNFFTGMDEQIGDRVPGIWLAVTSISFDISVLRTLLDSHAGFSGRCGG